jgi:hypothetical protein
MLHPSFHLRKVKSRSGLEIMGLSHVTTVVAVLLLGATQISGTMRHKRAFTPTSSETDRIPVENSNPLEWESDTDQTAIIKPSTYHTRKLRSSGRIAWGQPARETQFPFAAYFQGDGFMCSGSLIAPSVVLTAAHCVRDSYGWINKTQTAVYLGSVNWNQSTIYKIQVTI